MNIPQTVVRAWTATTAGRKDDSCAWVLQKFFVAFRRRSASWAMDHRLALEGPRPLASSDENGGVQSGTPGNLDMSGCWLYAAILLPALVLQLFIKGCWRTSTILAMRRPFDGENS